MTSSKRADHLEEARRIILQEGTNSTAYQIMNPGIRRWFSPKVRGLVGYVRYLRTRVAAGDPVTAPSHMRDVAAEFTREARKQGDRVVCWFCASEQFVQQVCPAPYYTAISIGTQPVWNPVDWNQKIATHASIRAQLRRAMNKGVAVREWPIEEASGNPLLERTLQQWLRARPFPSLHFLVEPRTLQRLFDRRIFVAEQNGEPIGFTLLSPVPCRNGWLVEQFVRTPSAPNGTTELMVSTAIEQIGQEGYDYVTLGLAPLSRRGIDWLEAPPFISLLFKWLLLHGRRFYNFEGLEFFKAKFHPDYWEPVYAVSNESRFSVRSLYAVAAAFSRGAPIRACLIAIIAAVRQELRWLFRRLRSRRLSVS